MKKTLLKFGVFVAAIYCTLAYAATGQLPSMLADAPVAKSAFKEAANPNVGVSIGTVEAQSYSESGLNLNYFDYAEYVAKTSEGTYLGFTTDAGRWIMDPETGEEIRDESMYAVFVAINSTEESVTVPDSIKVGEEVLPVVRIDSYWGSLQSGFSENIKNLTVPATVNLIYNNNFDQYLSALYMLGAAPQISSSLNVKNIFVCNKQYLYSYYDNSYYSDSVILPYGWDYEWITVNVEKPGEFAETYLTQNNYDWSAAQYVKVAGNINDIDVRAIKNLTTLMKLDLSETSITELPESFMYSRTSLVEIKLPATIAKIGASAFYGCKKLQSFDLNGITEIRANVFCGCKSLKNIDLSTVISIGSDAFRECSSLESVDLSCANAIGSNSFNNCASLKNVILGKNVREISSGAFYNTAIESVSLPEELTSLGNMAFYGCKSLEEITIPSTVKVIGSNAFGNTAIKTFKCYAVVPPIADSSFIGYNMDMTQTYLYVPPFSKDFYRNTDYWCDFYLMRAIEDPIDYILVDRPLTINLEEEDNAVVANNPIIDLCYGETYRDQNYNWHYYTGQLSAVGEGTLSAGQLTISGILSSRHNESWYSKQYIPTLINYADKMRADNVSHNFVFYNMSSGGEWHFISLPYDVKVADIVPGDNTYWVIRRYDSAARAAGETSSTWVDLNNDDTLEAGKGYIISTSGGEPFVDQYGNNRTLPRLTFTSGNSVTKNNIFRSTDVIVPLSEYAAEFAHNRSWNLIGNPYPCYFDMHYLNEEFTAPVTVWNGYAYVAYSPVDDDLVLSPYEAFFVQCPLDATEMTFKEGGRLHSDEGRDLYKVAPRLQETIAAEDRNVFNFVLTGEKYEDRARIVLNPDAKSEYEIGRDASKFFADGNENAQIYVSADVACSINERPVNDGSAILGVRSAREMAYTLSLSGKYSEEWSVMLTDNEAGVTVDLTKESYSFTTTTLESSSRFSVRFMLGDNGSSSIDSIASDFGKDAQVTVTGINGIVVFEGSLSDITVPAAGIYLISNGTETRKAILK